MRNIEADAIVDAGQFRGVPKDVERAYEKNKVLEKVGGKEAVGVAVKECEDARMRDAAGARTRCCLAAKHLK